MKDERIDKYISGEMSEDERSFMERELTSDPELQTEITLQRDIVRAVRMKAAKEYLQQVELTIQTNRRRRNVFVLRFSGFAVAACLLLGIFVHFSQVTDYKTVGNTIDLVSDYARGNEPATDAIRSVIENKEYAKALNMISFAEEQEFKSEFTHPDLIEQDRLEHELQMETLRWYKTVVYMRMGKWVKARKMLKQIANSNGLYKSQAQSVLDQLQM